MAAKITPITKDILGMEPTDHLIKQTFPAIATVDIATYNIDPPGQVSAPRLEGATLRQFSRVRRGHPAFEYLPLPRWENEADGRHYLKNYGVFDYLHNWCMPKYVLHLGLSTSR